MKNQRSFLRCDICGNIVGVIEDNGANIICCGKVMEALVPNTVDASQEKHVPIASRDGCTLKVSVGSESHPMAAEHHISWIALAQGNMTQRVSLSPASAPEAEFCVEGPVTVYAYCNLHGLWAADL